MKRIPPSYRDDPPETLERHPFYGFTLSEEQRAFRDAIWDPASLLIICNARAGTGKTMVSVATGNLLVEYRRYRRLVYIATPVQEGRLGYLPGTVSEKSSVYAEPLFGALTAIGISPTAVASDSVSADKFSDQYIQFITPVYLRGANIRESVVIVDEAQNFSMTDLKKVLTRVQDDCKVILIGHTGQSDIPGGGNAFSAYLKAAREQPFARVCELTQNFRGVLSNWADSIKGE